MRLPRRLAPLLATAVLAMLVWGFGAPRGAAAADLLPRSTRTADLLFRAGESSAPPELAVTFEEAAVLASELSPGGDAVFWSVAREPLGAVQRVVRHHGMAVVDAQGEARFEPDTGAVLLKSV